MLITIFNMDHCFQDSIYYWLWLFLSLNSALLVLVCSQCSPTRHSACLWRCISHLVFGILHVGSLMFSWQTVCHQVLAAGHLKPRSLGPFYEQEWNMLCMWICECVWGNGEIVCECMHVYVQRGDLFKSHTGCGHWIPSGHQSQKYSECLAICPSPFWHAGLRVLLTVQTSRDPLNEAPCLWDVCSCMCCGCVCAVCIHAHTEWVVQYQLYDKDFLIKIPKYICLLILFSSDLYTWHLTVHIS